MDSFWTPETIEAAVRQIWPPEELSSDDARAALRRDVALALNAATAALPPDRQAILRLAAMSHEELVEVMIQRLREFGGPRLTEAGYASRGRALLEALGLHPQTDTSARAKLNGPLADYRALDDERRKEAR